VKKKTGENLFLKAVNRPGKLTGGRDRAEKKGGQVKGHALLRVKRSEASG